MVPVLAQYRHNQAYGASDIGVDYANNAGVDNAGNLRLDSGTLYGNRWGVRGTEDLGGGLKSLFTLESGFALNNGASAQGGLLFGRQSFVGLHDDFGTLTLGVSTALMSISLRKCSCETDYKF